MSNPVTNVEIEDVLSSIRRLVTEDDRSEKAEARPVVNDTVDRLVLTPALRVADVPQEDVEPEETLIEETQAEAILEAFEPAEEQNEERSEPEEAPDHQFAELTAEEEMDEAWIEAGTTDDMVSGETENQLGDDVPLDAVDEEFSEEVHMDSSEVEDAADAGSEPDALEDPPWKNGDTYLFQAAQLAEKTDAVKRDRLAAAAEAAKGRSAETLSEETNEFEIETSTAFPEDAISLGDYEIRSDDEETSGETGSLEQPQTDEHATADESFSPGTDAGEEDLSETDDVRVELPSFRDTRAERSYDNTGQRASNLSAKIEALEAAIAETQDQWEPDGQVGDDYAGTQVDKIVWPESDEPQEPEISEPLAAQVESEPETIESATVEASELSQQTPEDAVLDEDGLRELVADIVRQELQGVLGERITRNVRKLVRREIHRALTTQELD